MPMVTIDDTPKAAKPSKLKAEPPKGFIELNQGDEIILVQVAHIVTVQHRQLVMVTQGTVTCDDTMQAICAKIALAKLDEKPKDGSV